ncbi:hypothetical protein SCUP515_10761 [Seiridium cupressi]
MSAASENAAEEVDTSTMDVDDAFALPELAPEDPALHSPTWDLAPFDINDIDGINGIDDIETIDFDAHTTHERLDQQDDAEPLEIPDSCPLQHQLPEHYWNNPPMRGIDEFFDMEGEVPITRPLYAIEWKDLDHVGKSVVLFELSSYHGSFQRACESLLLSSDEIEAWVRVFRDEQAQEARWKSFLDQSAWEYANSVDGDFEHDGPVEMELLTNAEMHKAANFVDHHGFPDVADRIKRWSHTKVAWPLPINLPTDTSYKIQDSNATSIGHHTNGSSFHELLDAFEDDNEDKKDDDDEDNDDNEDEDDCEAQDEGSTDSEEISQTPVRALFSVALTSPKIKVRNSIRLLTCILPRGTVVIGPCGRQILEEAGEYRVSPPPPQFTPVEDESQLDFVTDDFTLTSIVHTGEEFAGGALSTPGQRRSGNSQSDPHSTSTDGDITASIETKNRKAHAEECGAINTAHNVPVRSPLREAHDPQSDPTDDYEKALAHILSPPNYSRAGDWTAPDDLENYQSPQPTFFEDVRPESYSPSFGIPFQVISEGHHVQQPRRGSSLLNMRATQANQGRERVAQSPMSERQNRFDTRTDLTELQRSIDEESPGELFEKVFSEAFPRIDPTQKREQVWNRRFHELECQYVSSHLMKPASETVTSSEIGYTIPEAFPGGTRPDPIAAGPVERAMTPAVVNDPLDLSFMTIPMPPGYAVISPLGYTMNFDTDHRGPYDGKAPPGLGGTYSFFLPEMVEYLPDDFRPFLHDWVGYRIFIPQNFGLVLDGHWLQRWAVPGMHQIAEIDGELDLLNEDGRYRIFNDTQPIGTPIDTPMKESSRGDVTDLVIQEAQRIIAPYKDYLESVEEEEKLEEARQAEMEKKTAKRAADKLARQRHKEDLQKIAADRKMERQGTLAGAEQSEPRPSGRGNRARRPNARYSELGFVPFTDDIDELLRDGDTDGDSSPGEEDSRSEDDMVHSEPEEDLGNTKLETNPQDKNPALIVLAPKATSQVKAQQTPRTPDADETNEHHSQVSPAKKGEDKVSLNGNSTASIGQYDTKGSDSASDVSLQKSQARSQKATTPPSQSPTTHGDHHPALKRSASLMTADDSQEEKVQPQTPAKKARGRPRKNTNELSRPRTQKGTENAFSKSRERDTTPTPAPRPDPALNTEPHLSGTATRHVLQSPAGTRSPDDNVSPITRKPCTEATRSESITVLPCNNTQTARSHLSSVSDVMMVHPSLPVRPVTNVRPTGLKGGAKALAMPKYELLSARKMASPDYSPSRPPGPTSIPAKPMPATVASPLREGQTPKRSYKRKIKSTANTASPTAPIVASAAETPASSKSTRSGGITNQQLSHRLPTKPPSAPFSGQQFGSTMPAPISGTGYGLQSASFHPPLQQSPASGSGSATGAKHIPAPTFQVGKSGNSPRREGPSTPKRMTAFNSLQIPPKYPSPNKGKDGTVRYHSLSGKLYLDATTAVQADQGAGIIDFGAATLAFTRIQEREKEGK